MLAATLFAAGCVVTSVYPFYTAKDLVFDPALLGDWVDADATNTPAEFIRTERFGEKGYIITALGGAETNSQAVHLFRLKGHLFIDTCITNRSLDWVPTHQVSKVLRLDPTVETANLNYDWLTKLVAQHPKAIRHLRQHDDPGDDGRVVLTADTAELQRFILKHYHNTNAWNTPTASKRRL